MVRHALDIDACERPVEMDNYQSVPVITIQASNQNDRDKCWLVGVGMRASLLPQKTLGILRRFSLTSSRSNS